MQNAKLDLCVHTYGEYWWQRNFRSLYSISNSFESSLINCSAVDPHSGYA